MAEEIAIEPKLLPNPGDPLHRQFWEFCNEERLCFQRCKGCGHWRHVPRDMCADCWSTDWEWVQSSGKGKLYTWTVVERPMHSAFFPDVPYASIIVELEEGVRMVSMMRDLPMDELEVDLPVEVVFERESETIVLPYFRPRTS
ncbi:MAG: OB-fold domain-containing protein [Candidatus Latescibacteria bacterium]|jgi:hypothetical protein|nr:OB-fold domain-containing protein [Candidatus Latescibacterota bacterium]